MIKDPAFKSLKVSELRILGKPRASGLTMVVDGLDTGWLSTETAQQLLEVCGAYVDLMKIGWLTSRFVSRDYLRRKISLYKSNSILSFTGGMLLEAAVRQDTVAAIIDEAAELGFDAMEISDSVVPLSADRKLRLMAAVQRAGMKAIVEVGGKGDHAALDPDEIIPVVERFLTAGAYKVILESEQVEKLFDGEVEELSLESLKEISGAIGTDHLIFEVPYGKPVSDVLGYVWWFVETFGVNVNLANVEPRHALAVETVRHGYGFRGGEWQSSDSVQQALSEVRS